jgi:photosystem II stability/assembly factor-like uncharacterized protein
VSSFAVATANGLFLVRNAARWTVEVHLESVLPTSVAVDPQDPRRLCCGASRGLWRSMDGGRRWDRVDGEVGAALVTSVAVSAGERSVVYVGTEPSMVYRSEDAGDTWREMSGMRALPSASSWSFPPKPETHHVRWIEPDGVVPGRVYVAIEAGALLRTLDGGRTWLDRVPGGPFDTHTAATHAGAPGRVYSAAGDGYFESVDGG